MNEVCIKCFLTLAKNLSFTETAKEMYMTQQAISKYIARMEEEIGFRLFSRSHHYVSLTHAGEAYVKLFQSFEEQYAEVTQENYRYYEELSKHIRLGYLERMDISSVINDALKNILATDPDLHFSGAKLSQLELTESFLKRDLDLMITYREFAPKGQGIRRETLLKTPLMLMVSPEDPAAGEFARVEDFRSRPYIKAQAGSEKQSETRERARKQCRELGLTPSKIVVVSNIESAYMAAELNQGILVSTKLSRESMRSNLCCIPIGGEEELVCFWHENTENKTAVRFVNLLKQAVAEKKEP